jgi:hypothetical protein
LPSGTLARPLWQPHKNAILYATKDSTNQVALWLTDLHGQTHHVVTGALDNYAWSPDGGNILTHGAGMWGIYTAAGAPVMMWNDNGAGAVAWWSPDGKAVLARSATTLTLVTLSNHTATPLLNFVSPAAGSTLAGAYALTGSPWSTDGRRFALVANGGTWHAGKALVVKAGPGTGLYIVTTSDLTKTPTLSDWGEHTGLSWSTPDPNTQVLAP